LKLPDRLGGNIGIVKNNAAIGKPHVRIDVPLLRLSNSLSIQVHHPHDDAIPENGLLGLAAIGLAEIRRIRLLVDKTGYAVLKIFRFEYPLLRARDGVDLVSNELVVRTADVIRVKGRYDIHTDNKHGREKQKTAKEYPDHCDEILSPFDQLERARRVRWATTVWNKQGTMSMPVAGVHIRPSPPQDLPDVRAR
jgi:hypothetical protein